MKHPLFPTRTLLSRLRETLVHHSLWQRLCLLANAVQQPHIQYRLALLLAAVLASLLCFLQCFQPATHPLVSGLA